ncbi:hypothetical protein KAFR_0I00310 [Kazachstania africana CBS 2517]|uniref:Tricalbin n=1 Tax=Kazachstania africana (strain ATCC 22294 / BCRC 22015 / CBS 2517 / CECT 1963 / NBRC 1671 / NRRL Y-8276) TaxID=1071382 RepID=H2AZL2_KAZAF|nr:hypothetical protein KAFR_0I00310 [Kazachstania africana CBS 2517]CCF59812.1 hypothetical protein KAFR_0I00310 [Kazachstania africana CBS 2517]
MFQAKSRTNDQSSLKADSNVQGKSKESGNLHQKMKNAYTTGSEQHRPDENRGKDDRLANRTALKGVHYANVPPKGVIVAKSNESRLPAPNKEGTLGSVPLEKVHPEELKQSKSRDSNKYDTSIPGPGLLDPLSKADQEKLDHAINSDSIDTLFPWRNVGKFHASGKGTPQGVDSKVIKAYIMETFYNDWYYNIAIVLGTCFFSWLFAYMGFSWWSLGFIFLATSSVYSTEYRRFNRNIRDDLKRITVEETLSGRLETTQWLNSFLSKFWVIYMPVLSQQVKDIANPILAGVAPGYGIDALSLDEFTLGTKAPSIRGIKSYTKTGKDTVEMDWSFAFTPNDVSDMTPTEAAQKINPKVALGVTLGKSFVSKKLPVLVEDMNVAGIMRITLKFGKIFPNIKIVQIQLLEPPLLEFALKPIGGDTLGLDVMSFLPGLKSFVKTMVDSVAGPMLYAPNHFDVDVEEIMAAQSNDAIGVLVVTVTSAKGLKDSNFITNTVDPYVVLKPEKPLPGDENEIRTAIKSNIKDPTWNETKYILLPTLDQKLQMSCYDFNDVRKDTLIGTHEFDLRALYQNPAIENSSSELVVGSKSKGLLNYSLHWFSVIEKPSSTEEMEQEEEEEEEAVSATAGIAKLTIQKVKYLDVSSSLTGNLSPCGELYIDGKLVKTLRTLRRINEPSWGETIETLIKSKSNSKLTLKIFDDRINGKYLLTEYSSNIEDLMGAADLGQEYVKGSSGGEIYFTAQWKPVELTGAFAAKGSANDPLGCIKLHVKDALVKSSLSGFGDIDPYFEVSLNRHVRYKSRHFSENKNPIFDELVYIPITSENQLFSVALYDYQSVGSDRFIGQYQVPVSQLIEKDQKSGQYRCKEEFDNTMRRMNLRDEGNRGTSDTMNLAVSFIPTIKVYSAEELSAVEAQEKDLQEKRDQFEKKQADLRQKMHDNPSDWEVAEVNDPFEEEEKELHSKTKMSLDELVSYNSGILTLQVLNGHLSRTSTYLHILVDNIPYPEFTSSKYKGGKLAGESSGIFIRDLKHSMLLFRVSKERFPKEENDVISEHFISTLGLLQKGYDKPTEVDFQGSKVLVQFLYNPSPVRLSAAETVQDTGILSLNIQSARGLLSADRNGKSDPFVTVYVNGKKEHKTKTIKKTLDPVWNEKAKLKIPSKTRSAITLNVFDWDRAGENDFLGKVALDIIQMKPSTTYDWEIPLDTQGTIKVQATFEPQYLRPTIELQEKSLSDAPLRALGNVSGAGMNAASSVAGIAGAGVGVASGGLKKGGNLLKSLGGGSKSKQNVISNSRSSGENSRRLPLSSSKRKGRTSADYDASIPDNSYAQVNQNGVAQRSSIDNQPQVDDGGYSIAGVQEIVNKRSRASSFARTLSPNSTYEGTLTIIAAEHIAKNVQFKVSLAQNGKIKSVYKTANHRAQENGIVTVNETCAFKASPEANLVIGAISRHTLGKDRDVGIAQILLNDPQIHVEENMAVKLAEGRIIVKVNYGHTGNEIPPVPEIPKEYAQ